MSTGPHLGSEEVAAYLDNTLSDAECARVKAHLADCDVCREEVVSVSKLLERAPQSRRRAITFSTLAAAAMFIAIIGLGVWTLRLHNQVQDLKKSDQAAARLRISEPALARADTDALLLLSAPGTIKAPLTAGAAAPNANGAVFWSREQQRCVIFARELTPLRGGSEYHVWFSAGAAYWDGGPLIPDTTGVAEMVVSTERWHPGESYIINIVIQPVPDDGSRRPVLSASIEQDVE